MKAQMGLPDMKLPIQFALTYPHRFETDYPRFNFMDYPALTFEKADAKVFRNLDLAYQALNRGGSAACALNAANEMSVAAFLNDQLAFIDIAKINEQVMNACEFIVKPTYEDYVEIDRLARSLATSFIG
jgi:1-deoxy-D-xylulose-5-phosphate reductoisomerase